MANNIGRGLRQALTVARRDFIATVFTPTFLLFLLSPMFTILFGAAGGLGASTVTESAAGRARMVVIAAPEQAAALVATDRQLRKVFGRSDIPPPLDITAPGRNPAAQARAAIMEPSGDVDAALFGPLDKPTILYGGKGQNEADYLAELAEQTLRAQELGSTAALSAPTKTQVTRTAVTASGHNAAALFAVMAIFLLTFFLPV